MAEKTEAPIRPIVPPQKRTEETSGIAGMSAEDLLTMLISRLGPGTQAQPPISNALTAFLEEELAEKAANRKREKAESLEMARRNAENARVAQATSEAEQEMCDHRLPNGNSRLSGQPNSDGRETLICLGCQKIWRDGIDEKNIMIPRHLVPSDVRRGRVSAF
jgi:hypothetical protein